MITDNTVTDNTDAGSGDSDSAEGTPMQELRLVAVSEDGTYAVLAVPGRGGRFSLPIDDRLRTVARGQFSRLAQYEIEVENPLRPKEIQDRIRAGETADEIADAAGIPIERVRRFEGPVLAEREYRAQEAQRSTVRGHTESGPGPRLGEIVAERLTEAGAPADSLEWDSRKRSDGNWQVHLQFIIEGRPQVAEWVFDPRRRQVMPVDDLARRLCLPQADWPEGRLGALGAPSATVTPIGSRLHHGDPRGEPRAETDRLSRGPAGPRAPEPARSREADEEADRDRAAAEASRDAAAVAQAGAHVAARAGVPADTHAPAAPYGAGVGPVPSQPAASAPASTSVSSATTAAGAPSSSTSAVSAAAGTAVSGAAAGGAKAGGAEASGAAASSADGQAAAEGSAPEQRPARPNRKSARGRRSSVPSWDEIMLGTSRQTD